LSSRLTVVCNVLVAEMGRKTVNSKHVARRQRSSCRRMCCVCVERHTICRWKSVAAVDDLRRPYVCRRRRCTEVRGQTKTRRQNMLEVTANVFDDHDINYFTVYHYSFIHLFRFCLIQSIVDECTQFSRL